jgi:hypothetical protein
VADVRVAKRGLDKLFQGFICTWWDVGVKAIEVKAILPQITNFKKKKGKGRD